MILLYFLSTFQAEDARIFIVNSYENKARQLLCEVRHQLCATVITVVRIENKCIVLYITTYKCMGIANKVIYTIICLHVCLKANSDI